MPRALTVREEVTVRVAVLEGVDIAHAVRVTGTRILLDL